MPKRKKIVDSWWQQAKDRNRRGDLVQAVRTKNFAKKTGNKELAKKAEARANKILGYKPKKRRGK